MAAKPLSATILIADANLESYYPMSGNSTDYKGNANGSDTSMTYQTSPQVNSDFAESALFGASSKINATRTTGLSGSFTIMAWVYRTGTGDQFMIESNVASYSNYWIDFQIDGSSKFNCALYDGPALGNHNPNIVSTATIASSTWTHCAFVRDTGSTKIKMYVAGSSGATDVTDTTSTAPAYSSFDIGCRTAGTSHFLGNLDDICIFSRALTASEISDYVAGTLAAAPSSASHRGFFNLVNQPA